MRAVITTVYNRPERMLHNTLSALRNALPNDLLIVVDDGSDQLPDLAAYAAQVVTIDTLQARPGTYNIRGYNNPAYAWNCGIDAAEKAGATQLLLLGSDCMLQPHMGPILDSYDLTHAVWQTQVIDLNTGGVYCHTKVPRPLPWCLAMTLETANKAGRYDEAYLRGMAFEDNDFAARACLAAGHLIIDDRAQTWHQSHEQTAYSDNLYGWKQNEVYTKQKWGGVVPFNDQHALTLTVLEHEQGVCAWRVERPAGAAIPQPVAQVSA